MGIYIGEEPSNLTKNLIKSYQASIRQSLPPSTARSAAAAKEKNHILSMPHSSSPATSAISSTVAVPIEQSTIPAATSAPTTTTDISSTQDTSLNLTFQTTAAALNPVISSFSSSPSETTTSLSTTFA
uniref:Uncharacterized protein n=1 Tax=Panagrolaimus sp. PS1159 TaxID=55785 RepID=A0AC35FG81_9BILA